MQLEETSVEFDRFQLTVIHLCSIILNESRDKLRTLTMKAGKQKSKPTLLVDKMITSRRLQDSFPEFVPREQTSSNFWETQKLRTPVKSTTSRERISASQISSEENNLEENSSFFNEAFFPRKI